MTLAETDLRAIERVAGLLEQSSSVLFITGAGISADSGLPTYRGIGGLYNVNATEDGLPIEELLSGHTMRRRPDLTWKYLGQVEQACRGARPNRAHEIIAEMEGRFERVWTLTQNVDGLHRQAGSRNLIEIHGDLHDLYCPRCGFRHSVPDYSDLPIPPRCLDCAGPVRPDVVLFGEALPLDKLAVLEGEMDRGFDLVFTVGTTSVFPYIAEPVLRAARGGKPTVEINPGTSEVSHRVSIRLPLRAAEALHVIWTVFLQRAKKRSTCPGSF